MSETKVNIPHLLCDPTVDQCVSESKLTGLRVGFRGERTGKVLAWVLLGDTGGRGLRKLELLHHGGGQETHCRTVNE